MSQERWYCPADKLPPQKQAVWTMNSAGEVTKLKLVGNLWWFLDMSMYVYYVPTFWKLV